MYSLQSPKSSSSSTESSASIVLEQRDADSPLNVRGTVTGLVPGRHGIHVHERANDGDDCAAAGPHYNPYDVAHGDVAAAERHVGDFGNIEADEAGTAAVDLWLRHASVFGGKRNVVGRTLVIHAGEDDLGLGGDDGSRATGNSGPRLACAVIRERAPEWTLTVVIIVALVVVIALLLVLILCLVVYCCCCKECVERIGFRPVVCNASSEILRKGPKKGKHGDDPDRRRCVRERRDAEGAALRRVVHPVHRRQPGADTQGRAQHRATLLLPEISQHRPIQGVAVK